MEEEKAIKRIEEQIGNDTTATHLNRIQKKLAKVKNEEKFDNKTHYKVYLSDAIPP